MRVLQDDEASEAKRNANFVNDFVTFYYLDVHSLTSHSGIIVIASIFSIAVFNALDTRWIYFIPLHVFYSTILTHHFVYEANLIVGPQEA
jgi:hypothetical protein